MKVGFFMAGDVKKISTRDLCYIGVMAAIITVCAQISIPMPSGVPMTLQTLAIPLAGVMLGTKKGTIAVLVYILLGLIGLPVFAGFTGGVAVVFGRTGGFILSFPLMAMTAGIGAKEYPNVNKTVWLTAWLFIGAAINFLCGMMMFSVLTGNNMLASFGFVVLPFIPTAVIKIIMVVIISKLVKPAILKQLTLNN